MPSTIYFIDYPEDFSDPAIDFKKGDQLLEIIARDPTLMIQSEKDQRTVFYKFDNAWIPFFDLQKDNDIYLNYRVVADSTELFYKLVEIADKLQVCLEVEDVLVFIPGYGSVYDPEDSERHLSFELYGYELAGKLTENPTLNVRDAINEIAADKRRKAVQLERSEGIRKKNQLQMARRRIRTKIFAIVFITAVLVYAAFLL